jgi:nucleotide-binding universal stress UspA family protein
MATTENQGPVLFAYDGSDLAKGAIAEAGRQLVAGREALVVTVWAPFNVGFVAARSISIDAQRTGEVRKAAEETAAEGASLAEAAGFRAQSAAVEDTPTWKAIVNAADHRDAALIVLGSHGRSGIESIVVGSVAAAVASHSHRSVLIVHPRI